MQARFGFSEREFKFLRNLKTPAGVQDFTESLEYNLEMSGDTCYSPRTVLRLRTADCIEGAIFAAAALRVLGFPPLIMDLEAAKGKDDDHVIAVFRLHGKWGAIGKSKFTGLGYRNPVYKDPRDLAMSYFNDYFNEKGEMTLRSFSDPVDLSRFDPKGWMTSEKNIWFVSHHLYKIRHHKLFSGRVRLRNASARMLEAGLAFDPRKSKTGI